MAVWMFKISWDTYLRLAKGVTEILKLSSGSAVIGLNIRATTIRLCRLVNSAGLLRTSSENYSNGDVIPSDLDNAAWSS